MKVFETKDRVNFVDENNVLVGYETLSQCSETFGWFFASEPSYRAEITDRKIDLTPFVFDPAFFESVEDVEIEGGDENGSGAAFKLVRQDGQGAPIYLILFNCHNGYYYHGFSMKTGGKEIRRGDL